MGEIYFETIAVNPAPSFQDIGEMSQVLRGEISAVEAYDQVLSILSRDPEIERLNEFLHQHKAAVAYWENEVHAEGVVPDHDSGPWGKVVEGIVATAKLLGHRAVFKILKEGEEHGLEEYKEMLVSKFVSPAHKRHIRDVFIPNQELHIISLNALMKMQ